MKICRNLALLSMVLAAMLSVPAAFGRSPAPPTTYVADSKKSDTRVNDQWPVASGREDTARVSSDQLPVASGPKDVADQKSEISKPEATQTTEGVQYATPAPTPPEASPPADISTIINACAATADDLKKERIYVNVLEAQNKLLNERLETEKRANAVLTELDSTRRDAMASLQSAIAAKNETISAEKDVIARQDKLIAELKSKKSSMLRRVGDVLIGVAIFAILK